MDASLPVHRTHGSAARMLVAALGFWLAASAFFWPHDRPSFLNALLTGLAMLGAGAAGYLGVRWARWLTMVLAVWLFLSTVFWMSHANGGTVLNQLLVAVLALFLSVIPPPALTDAEPGAGVVPR